MPKAVIACHSWRWGPQWWCHIASWYLIILTASNGWRLSVSNALCLLAELQQSGRLLVTSACFHVLLFLFVPGIYSDYLVISLRIMIYFYHCWYDNLLAALLFTSQFLPPNFASTGKYICQVYTFSGNLISMHTDFICLPPVAIRPTWKSVSLSASMKLSQRCCSFVRQPITDVAVLATQKPTLKHYFFAAS